MNTEQLRAAIEMLPPIKPFSQCKRFTWEHRQSELRKRILKDDPTKFLTWSMIHEALFVGDAPWVNKELDKLRDDNWLRWKKGIEETEFGAPTRMAAHEDTSGNMVHQAYILQQWENLSLKRVESLGSLFEFGGGYGAMARLCNQLGFRGPHIIHDLLEFLLLQRFYLSNTGVSNAVFAPDVDGMDGLEVDLFIAGCSLSEVPFEIRDNVLSTIKAKNYVILYQGHYMKRDNHGYFTEFRESHPELVWTNYQVPHWPRHWYLVGTTW